MRLQYDISPAQNTAIKELKAVIGAGTTKELLNNALSLLEWAVEERKKGCIITSIDKENNVKELVMPAFSFIKSST